MEKLKLNTGVKLLRKLQWSPKKLKDISAIKLVQIKCFDFSISSLYILVY